MLVASKGKYDLHMNQSSRISCGTNLSQSILSSNNCCRNIFTLMIVGENHENTLNNLVMSETNAHMVTVSKKGYSATFRLKKIRFDVSFKTKGFGETIKFHDTIY